MDVNIVRNCDATESLSSNWVDQFEFSLAMMSWALTINCSVFVLSDSYFAAAASTVAWHSVSATFASEMHSQLVSMSASFVAIKFDNRDASSSRSSIVTL